MARSQILKDLVSGEQNLESVLMRLKVILSDLDNEEINKWINNEIQGYSEPSEVPPFRAITGHPVGTYLVGYTKYSNAEIPLKYLGKDLEEKLLTVYITDGALGLTGLLNNDGIVGKPIPAEICTSLSYGQLRVVAMNIEVSYNQIHGIIANIKNILTDIVLKIENEYGNLDSLDVFSENSPQNLKKIEQYIINVIYDKSISIGDSNKIKGSDIGHGGENSEP